MPAKKIILHFISKYSYIFSILLKRINSFNVTSDFSKRVTSIMFLS